MEHSKSASSADHHNDLINELKQGKELAKQLLIHLNVPSSSREAREFLVHKILLSYDKALSMLNSSTTSTDHQQHTTGTATGIILSESPRSFSGSPRSEDSDHDFKDPDNKNIASRKRKAMPRWTKQVQIYPGAGLEGPLDDGYSWRKYGQKDILGAKYPRGYYRCTNRHIQGCLATKQVQRSDNDPTIFEITYRGRHTCAQASNLIPAVLPQPQLDQNPEAITSPRTLNFHDHHQPPQNHQPQYSQEVIAEDLDTREQRQSITPPPSSFYFPSTSNNEAQSYSFAQYYNMLGNNFVGNISSPSFVSASNYYNLSLSPSNMSSFGEDILTRNMQASDSELTEIISAPTSATNSPTVGVNFPLGQLEFNSNFIFDNPGF